MALLITELPHHDNSTVSGQGVGPDVSTGSSSTHRAALAKQNLSTHGNLPNLLFPK